MEAYAGLSRQLACAEIDSRQSTMELKDIITAVAATIGAGLGIYNFFHARAADRVRLKVTPMSASYRGIYDSGAESYLFQRDSFDFDQPGGPPHKLAIEVINLSKFAVIVDEVGLQIRWHQIRHAMASPILPDGKPWPRRLQPRESVIAVFDMTRLLEMPELAKITHAYAATSCGAKCKGRSAALRDLTRMVQKA